MLLQLPSGLQVGNCVAASVQLHAGLLLLMGVQMQSTVRVAFAVASGLKS
jgi:hypothetical protein